MKKISKDIILCTSFLMFSVFASYNNLAHAKSSWKNGLPSFLQKSKGSPGWESPIIHSSKYDRDYHFSKYDKSFMQVVNKRFISVSKIFYNKNRKVFDMGVNMGNVYYPSYKLINKTTYLIKGKSVPESEIGYLGKSIVRYKIKKIDNKHIYVWSGVNNFPKTNLVYMGKYTRSNFKTLKYWDYKTSQKYHV